MTMTWEVTPADGGTHVEITAENVPDERWRDASGARDRKSVV